MKSKILTLIIGILIGAIIATTGFLIYTKVNEKSNVNNRQMKMRGNGEMPNGEAPSFHLTNMSICVNINI